MGLYPVTVQQQILISHEDGQPYLFWRSTGGGGALANQSDCLHQIGEAARTLVGEYLERNMKTYLEAKVDIYEDDFSIRESSVVMNEEYTLSERPRSLKGKDPNLAMHYGYIRDRYTD